MNRKARTAIYIAFFAILVGIIVIANVSRLNGNVRSIKAVVELGEDNALVSPKALEQLVNKEMPTLRSTAVKDVDKEYVRKSVLKSPYVDSCLVSISINGDVIVHAFQCKPVVRLFIEEQEFYLDRKGNYIPLSKEGSADVIVANGEFKNSLPKKLNDINRKYLSSKKGSELNKIWTLALYLYNHPDDGVFFDQIYLEKQGDLYLIPKLGTHKVLVGDPDNLDEKIFNLMAFYKEGCSKVGWDTYSQISLKYKGQVICTERDQKQ